jgi:hypothetical protein
MGNPGNDRRIDNIEFAVSDIARSREFYGRPSAGPLRTMARPIASSAMGG